MPWYKLVKKLDGSNYVDMRKPYASAEECMNNFSRFEKDTSFGCAPCWPIFYPYNDEELDFFNKIINDMKKEKKDPTKELADKLLSLVEAVTEHIQHKDKVK